MERLITWQLRVLNGKHWAGEKAFMGYLDSEAKISVVRRSVAPKRDSTGATIKLMVSLESVSFRSVR